MALLDEANTSAYGNPEITTVDLSVGTRPGILVSGHDLRDLEMLLEQTVTPASMFTPTPKCCLHTTIRRSKNMNILREIMVTPGGSRKKNLKPSTARF